MAIDTIRISELQDAASVAAVDLVPINVYSTRDGYTLTKKATIKKISDAVYGLISAQISVDNKLSTLSHMDPITLLEYYMYNVHNSRTENNLATSPYDSLAVSTYYDLGLGDLASTNINDLKLDSFIKKVDANFDKSYPISTYIVLNGIHLVNGKITAVDAVNLKELFPIDSEFKLNSENPIKNSTITNEFTKVVYKDNVNAEFPEVQNSYVTGLKQINGKIEAVYTRKLPEYPVDDYLSPTSTNPVQNKVLNEALNLKIQLTDDKSNSLYVKKIEANSILNAPVGHYINSIQLTNGKITHIDTALLPSSANNVDSNKYITGITQVDGKITEVKSESLPSISHTAQSGKYIAGLVQQNGKITSILTNDLPVIKVDTEMSLTSRNPVENQAITKKINEIKAGVIIPAEQVLLTLNLVYPVGSIFLTTTNVCPLQSLGIGTWQKVDGGYALWTGNGSNGNNTIAAGLPSFPSFSASTSVTNNTFSASGTTSSDGGSHSHKFTVKFSASNGSSGYPWHGSNSACAHSFTGTTDSSSGKHTHSFTLNGTTNVSASTTVNVSGVSSLYGKSSTVLPPAYIVNVFRRIS